MALATRCPQCGTTFKVAHDQLKLRAGMVRCGACKQVFNGIEHLVRTDQAVAVSSTAASRLVKPVEAAHSPAPSVASVPAMPATSAPAVSAAITPAPVSPAKQVPVEPAPSVAPIPTPAPTLAPAPAIATVKTPAADLPAQNTPAKAAQPGVEIPPIQSAHPAPIAASKTPAAKSGAASSLLDFSAPDSQFTKAEIAAKSGPVHDDTPRPSPSGIVFEPLIMDLDEDVAATAKANTAPVPTPAPVPPPAPVPAPVTKVVTKAVPVPTPAPQPIADSEPHFDIEHVDAAPPPWDFTPGNTLPTLEQTTLANFPREEISAEKAAQVLAALDAGPDKSAAAIKTPAEVAPSEIEAAAVPAQIEAASAASHSNEGANIAASAAEFADEEQATHRHVPHLDAAELADDLAQDEQRKHEELIRLAAEDSAQLASDTEEPGFVKRERRRRSIGRVLNGFMLLSSILLTFGALGQATYVFRDQLAASVPASKPWLLKACALLNCQIGFPSQIKAVSLEGDELQTLPHLKNLFALSTLLRNHSNTVQSWPSIELSLNDEKDKVLARRVFAPQDYLANPQDQARGFAAHGEQAVKLYFELNQIKASGYRVYLFYP